MPDFLITLHYGPRQTDKKHYLVENQPTQYAAKVYLAENVILYDPGVPVDVTETPINENPTYRYSNLGRFND